MGSAAISLCGLLLSHWLLAVLSDPLISSISRHHKGDMFVAGGASCGEDACIGSSSGTAVAIEGSACTCQCLPHLTVFRDDLHICIDDVHECSLAPFVSGTTTQRIPFVFLPLRGQIVYPSAEINFAGVLAPICVVSSAQFLTRGGWVDVRNNSYLEPPFRLFRDEGRTFLQWLGDGDLRVSMEGRLVLVHLMCKDMAATPSVNHQYIFTPCVSFRVAGTPSVREVSFAADAHAADDHDQGLSVSEYVAIGVCSVLLGLIYVASVFLYLHVRRRRHGGSVGGKDRVFRGSPNLHLAVAEDGVIKNNPLLQTKRQRHLTAPSDNPCYHSDQESCGSDSDPGEVPITEDNVTSAVVHSCGQLFDGSSEECCYSGGFPLQDSNSFERLPEQNVSIVETLDGREERSETVRAITNGTFRRKLYFNPAYFEPEMLLAPPPGAIEFLTKIREVILIARHKMAAKRFSPTLSGIPEEDASGSVIGGDVMSFCAASSRRSSGTVSLKRLNSRLRGCTGCPGCEVLPAVLKPCCVGESKQTSIRRWLEDVSPTKTDPFKHRAARVLDEAKWMTDNDVISCGGSVAQSKQSSGSNFSQCSSPGKTTPSPPLRASKRMSPKPLGKTNGHQCPSTTSTCSENTRSALSESSGGTKETSSDKNHLMDAVIKELVVVGQRGCEATDALPPHFSSPTLTLDIQKNVDGPYYDADSLEKSKYLKEHESGFHTPSDYGDVSSQPSPCLSSALPMDEEMVMRNDVFNKKTGNKTISKLKLCKKSAYNPPEDHDYEVMLLNPNANKQDSKLKMYSLPELFNNNKGYSLVSEVYVNDDYNFSSSPSSPGNTSTASGSSGSKIRYVDEKKPGHLTIEVEDSPENYRYNPDDSDEFEPDTLDRKPSKRGNLGFVFNSCIPQRKSENFIDSLERNSQILLRTNGSFRSDSVSRTSSYDLEQVTTPSTPLSRTFGSLREIYEARTKGLLLREQDNASIVGSTRSICSDTTDCNYTLSRQRANKMKQCLGYRDVRLSPDSRQARRQRRPTPPGTIKYPKKLAPPDVIPPRPPKPQMLIYENPPPPKPIHQRPAVPSRVSRPPLPPKNGQGRSTSQKNFPSYPAHRPLPPIPRQESRRNSVSSNSSASRDSGTPSSSTSADSLQFSDGEAFYTIPYSKDEPQSDKGDITPTHLLQPKSSSPDIIRKCTVNNQAKHHKSGVTTKQPNYEELSRTSLIADRDKAPKVPVRLHGNNNKYNEMNKDTRIKTDSGKTCWQTVRLPSSKVTLRPEDSGYLSTDSEDLGFNPQQRPPDSVSETDESLCDGASESGGESIATDSFFFGTSRKPATSVDSGVGSELLKTLSQSALVEDVGENTSDSENVSFVTVLSPCMTRKRLTS